MASLESGSAEGTSLAAICARLQCQMLKRLQGPLSDDRARFGGMVRSCRDALSAAGHGSRAQDQFGTLLALLELLLGTERPEQPGDAAPLAHLGPKPQFLGREGISREASPVESASGRSLTLGFPPVCGGAARGSDAEACLAHLMAATVEDYRCRPLVIGDLVQVAAESFLRPDGQDARRILDERGLRLVAPMAVEAGLPWHLAISNNHHALAEVFAGSPWMCRWGSRLQPWARELRRLSGAEPSSGSLWFAGSPSRAVLLPLAIAAPQVRPAPGVASRARQGCGSRLSSARRKSKTVNSTTTKPGWGEGR